MIANDILVIADKPRIQHLLDGVEPAWGGSVTIVSSLAAAEEHLAGGTVGLLIIQDRLSGLSHELLLRHLRSLVNERDLIIACAGDDPDIHDPEIHHLDLSLPDRELVRQIERFIARLPRPDLSPFRNPPPVNGEGANPPSLETAPPEEPAPDPDERERFVRRAVASRFEAELETELARREEPSPSPVEPPPVTDKPPTPQESTHQFSPRILVIPLILLLIVAGIWGLVFRTKPLPSEGKSGGAAATPKTPSLPPASVQPPAAPPTPGATFALPSFITREGPRHDPAYASSKPGWQRYETPSAEFRIYAPRGEATAVQVIGKTPEGLSPGLFAAALRELAGVRDYQTRERRIEKEYLVKRGTLGDRGRVTLYKDQRDRILHAFVIDLSEGEKKKP